MNGRDSENVLGSVVLGCPLSFQNSSSIVCLLDLLRCELTKPLLIGCRVLCFVFIGNMVVVLCRISGITVET